jgi:hypothetical protein
MSAMHDWWASLTPERQEALNEIARESILQLDCYPMIYEVAAELLEWQQLELEVLDAHADWLARTKAKFERRGLEWTTENLNRYSRLWECE